MVRDDPVQKLREAYEVWSQFKHSVADWFQTNGWLIELGVVGVVGFIVVVILAVLILAALLASIESTAKPTASQGQSGSPPMSVKAYWEERKKQQEAERKEQLGEGIKPDGEINSLQPWWTKPFWGVVFVALCIGGIVALITLP